MNLLLISKTAIIKQIFNLVTTKLDISLTISDVNISHKTFDIIIIEDDLLDDNFPLQTYAKRFGIISKDAITLQDKCDFILPKPFLPSSLLTTLNKELNTLKVQLETPISACIPTISEEDEYDETMETVDFIETLADDISDEILEESDESVVSSAFVKDGGILDSTELSKIQNILTDDSVIENENTPLIDKEVEEADEWIDLADIIDKAIDEVKEYSFDTNAPIKLMLNEYSMQELSPLFNKLDQSIIDALTEGQEITIQLKVDKNED